MYFLSLVSLVVLVCLVFSLVCLVSLVSHVSLDSLVLFSFAAPEFLTNKIFFKTYRLKLH